jgi:trigger factor
VRRHLAEQRRRQWEILSQQNLRSELVSRLIEKNPFELPQSMVDYYLDSLHEHEHEHDHEHGEEERRMAERSLKRHLLLEGVRKKVSIQVSDQEFEEYLARRAAEAGVKVEDLKRSPRLGELRRELEEDKVFEFLLERARITEEKV